jgi:hypothetical protein
LRRIAALCGGLALAVLGLAAHAASPLPTVFGQPIDLPGADRSRAVAVADVTGDGKNDVVLAGYEDAQVVVHPGNGDGTFGAAQTIATSYSNVHRIVVGRLNSDAADDLVLCQESAARIEVLVSDGNGGLVPTAFDDGPSGAFLYAEMPALTDWDGDGDVDLLYRIPSQGVGVRVNDGSGQFGAWSSVTLPALASRADDIVARDFDGDGDVDLLVDGDAMQVFWRQEDGTFADGQALSLAFPRGTYYYPTTWTSAADLDGDGFADFLDVFYPGNGAQVAIVNVLHHQSGTTYEKRIGSPWAGAIMIPTNIARSPQGPVVVDINGDDRPDLVTPRGVILNAGDGTFALTPPMGYPATLALPVAGLPLGVAVGDLNGDGRPDIVTVTDANTGGGVAAQVVPVLTRLVTLTSMQPTKVYPGGRVRAVLTGTSFVDGDSLDLGEGVTVSDVVVESPTSIRATVAVAPDAAVGPRDLQVTNADGLNETLTEAVVVTEGGVASVASLSPEVGHAGGTLDVDIAGAGFLDGATASFGAGATVNSAEVLAEDLLRVNVTFTPLAPLGLRDVTVTNGSGIDTVMPASFTVLRPPTIALAARHGRLRVSSKPARGSFHATGTFRFDAASPDGVFLPATETAEIRFGDANAPALVVVPPAIGWKVRGARAEWRTPRRTAGPSVRLVYDLARSTFRLDVTHVDLALPESGDVVVDLTLGDDNGFSLRHWEAPRRGGGLVLK